MTNWKHDGQAAPCILDPEDEIEAFVEGWNHILTRIPLDPQIHLRLFTRIIEKILEHHGLAISNQYEEHHDNYYTYWISWKNSSGEKRYIGVLVQSTPQPGPTILSFFTSW